MKVGDIANIRNHPSGFWKGKVTQVSNGYDIVKYAAPIFSIEGLNGKSHSVNYESDFIFCPDDGEYYEKKE
jgi:hypothetical protein